MHSLELGEHARDAGVFREVHRRLFTAYWSQHLDIGDPAVLESIAVASGEAFEDAMTQLGHKAIEG